MSDFLNEFLLYFFPTISNLPDWCIVLLGVVVLCFVFRFLCAIVHVFGGNKI